MQSAVQTAPNLAATGLPSALRAVMAKSQLAVDYITSHQGDGVRIVLTDTALTVTEYDPDWQVWLETERPVTFDADAHPAEKMRAFLAAYMFESQRLTDIEEEDDEQREASRAYFAARAARLAEARARVINDLTLIACGGRGGLV